MGGYVRRPLRPEHAIPNIFNFKPQNNAKVRRGLSRMLAGLGNMNIACIGDSTVWAALSEGRDPNKAWPAHLARRLAGTGLPASYQSFFGTGISSSTALPVDPRLAFTGDWVGDGNQSVGGKMLISASATNTPTMSWSPAGTVDTHDVYYMRSATSGTFTLDINGGAATTVNSQGGTLGIAKATITGAAGTHVLNVKHTAGGTTRIVGIVSYNSAQRQVNCLNMGWSGSKTAEWSSTSQLWAPSTVLPVFAADLHIVCLTINDINNNVPLATYLANLQIIINACLAGGGDVWLMSGVPSNPASFPGQDQQRQYCEAMKSLAAANDLTFIDMHAIWQSFAVSGSGGLGQYTDNLHPGQIGYPDIGRATFNLLARL